MFFTFKLAGMSTLFVDICVFSCTFSVDENTSMKSV